MIKTKKVYYKLIKLHRDAVTELCNKQCFSLELSTHVWLPYRHTPLLSLSDFAVQMIIQVYKPGIKFSLLHRSWNLKSFYINFIEWGLKLNVGMVQYQKEIQTSFFSCHCHGIQRTMITWQ